MMIQPTKRQIELRRLLMKESDPEKRKKLMEEYKKAIDENPVRKAMEGIFAG